jgi:hypothetical protein
LEKMRKASVRSGLTAKRAAKPETSRASQAAGPARSRATQPQAATGGSLSHQAAMINSSPRIQQLKQLKDGIQHGLGMQEPEASPAPGTIQAKLKNPFEDGPVADPEISRILMEAEIYNKIGGWRFSFPLQERKQALTQLGKIERLIYRWFTNQESPDLNTSPSAIRMKELMNLVQAERQSLVAISVAEEDDVPPVANFDELPDHLREQITLIWKALLKGQGIQIEGPKEFRIKILTDFSRLLETEMGRTLAGGIIETGQGLVIHPTTLAAGKYVARPNDPEKEGIEQSEASEGFVPVDVRNLNEPQRLRLLQHVRGANPKSPGMSVTSERGVRHFRFGTGTGSTLPVPIDSRDAMNHVSSRMADAEGRESITPTFIALGHELGHVLRSAQGISASGDGGRSLLEHSFESPEVSRPEEFFNIGGVENRLRAETGIRTRHGHGNLYTHWAIEGMESIEKLVREIARDLPKVPPHSEEALLLKGLREELLGLQEPFQNLLNGRGEIAPLLARLNGLQRRTMDTLADLDHRRRRALIAHRGGNISTSSEGNAAIGDADL